MTESVSYTMNNWCDETAITFDYQYKWQTLDWMDANNASSISNYSADLYANGTSASTWTENEQDIDLQTRFTVTQSPSKFSTQPASVFA